MGYRYFVSGNHAVADVNHFIYEGSEGHMTAKVRAGYLYFEWKWNKGNQPGWRHYQWRFPTAFRRGSLVVFDVTAGQYRSIFLGDANNPPENGRGRPWKLIEPSNPTRWIEDWFRVKQ